jgi:hypothetical protein
VLLEVFAVALHNLTFVLDIYKTCKNTTELLPKVKHAFPPPGNQGKQSIWL